MAKRRPRPTQPRETSGSGEDAFTAGILNVVAWARERTQLLVISGTVVALLVAGTFYWFNQRGAQLDAAAQELEQLQQAVGFEDPATAVASVQGYLDRFGETQYGIEARMLLARVHLIGQEDPAAAIEVLEPVAPDFSSPLNVHATFMLASVFEQAERWAEAMQTYEELRTQAEFSFQRREAGEGLARTHLAQGDTAQAVQAYEEILTELDPEDANRARYEMRLAELTAGGV